MSQNPSPTATIPSMTLTPPPDPEAEVVSLETSYVYDGDGRMVKAVVTTHYEDNTSSTVTTIYIGGLYEFESVSPRFGIGFDTERKYYAGVAMRENDELFFNLCDHPSATLRTGLGSASMTANSDGILHSEQHYDP